MSEMKTFFKYVIPAILSFALSGVYAIVDGFFVGHSVGDLGLSAINVAYPVSAILQAAGTGIGMGGAVYYCDQQGGKRRKTGHGNSQPPLYGCFCFSSVILTLLTFVLNRPILQLLGAEGQLLALGGEYNAGDCAGRRTADPQHRPDSLHPQSRRPFLCHDFHDWRVYHQCNS